MHRNVTVVAICLAATATSLDAQSVRGRISDDASRLGVRGAAVALLDARGGESALATTDTAGLFELRAPRADSYRLRVMLIGYIPYTSEPLDVQSRETVQVTILLSTQAIPLAALVVVGRRRASGQLAAFEKRRAERAGGHFIAQEDIDRRPVATTTTLLIGMPGIVLRPLALPGRPPSDRNVITLPGGLDGPCIANVFVNGILTPQSPTVDDVLNPAWLGGIEVYPRAASAPIEFQRPNGCGVVLFWTREAQRARNWSWLRIAIAGGFAVAALVATR